MERARTWRNSERSSIKSSRRWSLAAALAAVVFTAVPASAISAAEQLASVTQETTPSGVAFKAPAGWSISTTSSLVLLDAPETGSHLAIVNVTRRSMEGVPARIKKAAEACNTGPSAERLG